MFPPRTLRVCVGVKYLGKWQHELIDHVSQP